MRSPYQILVFPFVKEEDKFYYAIFKREDLNVWQGLSGGGEEGETPAETAKRESYEEALIDRNSRYIRLASIFTTPVEKICKFTWGKEIIMIPEIPFGVEVSSKELKLSHEHTEYAWLSVEEALEKLEWDSNKASLWELNYRLMEDGLAGLEKNIKIVKEAYKEDPSN